MCKLVSRSRYAMCSTIYRETRGGDGSSSNTVSGASVSAVAAVTILLTEKRVDSRRTASPAFQNLQAAAHGERHDA